MTNREITDSIDELIQLRIQNATATPASTVVVQNEDRIEQLKREITDAFVERDFRKGVIADSQLQQL